MTTASRQFNGDTVRAMAQLIGLDVAPDRAPLLAEELTRMYGEIDRLAAVPLGETPPATAFDARWR